MWTTIALLWFIPLAAGVVILARAMHGKPLLTAQEWHLFFGDAGEKNLSPRVWLKFGVLAIVFFIVGLFEGLVLVNIDFICSTAPLLTGLGAMLAGLALASNDAKESLWLAKGNARPLGGIFGKPPRPQSANKH